MSTTPAPRTEAGAGMRRLGWGLADQSLSSLTNFALAVLVARSVSIAALGAFGLAFTTYTVTLNATRALCSEPLTVRYSATDEAEWREGASAATGTRNRERSHFGYGTRWLSYVKRTAIACSAGISVGFPACRDMCRQAVRCHSVAVF